MVSTTPRARLFALCSFSLAFIAVLPLLLPTEHKFIVMDITESSTLSLKSPTAAPTNEAISSEPSPLTAIPTPSSEKLIIWMKKPFYSDNAQEKIIVAQLNSTFKVFKRITNVEYKVGSPKASYTNLEKSTSELNLFCDNDDEPECSSNVGLLLRRTLVDVTYWNEKLQVHESLNHTRENGRPRRMMSHKCSGETCPRNCPEGYLWDPIDYLCKPVFPEREEFSGPCKCRTTCFTPEAVQPNSTYPWKSLSQKEEFHSPHGNFELLQQKQGTEKRRKHTYKPRFQCSVNHNTTLPQSIRSTFQHFLYYMPEHKLIFCGIPKSGISEWLRFFRYTLGAKDYLSWGHFKSDLSQFHVRSLTTRKAQELLFQDPSWTKAVFLREPAERLLSGYLDKIAGTDWSTTRYGQNDTLSFADFVDLITKPKRTKCKAGHSAIDEITGLNTCTDPHFRPQMLSCGLDYLLPSFDFIGIFPHISEHTKMLLKKVRMWDDYGSKYDDGNGAEMGSLCYRPPPLREANFTPDGFNQLSRSKNRTTLHATQSSDKMDQYYTSELLAKVRKAYHWDYAIWDDLVKRPSRSGAAGNDLEIVRSYCSARAAKQSRGK